MASSWRCGGRFRYSDRPDDRTAGPTFASPSHPPPMSDHHRIRDPALGRRESLAQRLADLPSPRRSAAGSDADATPEGQHRPLPAGHSATAQQNRLRALTASTGTDLSALARPTVPDDPSVLRGNIEQYVGMTQVPTGVIGPLQIDGTAARGSFYVPLATTEGALVASYNRGAKATRLAGGITAATLSESVQRAPTFRFADLGEVGRFLQHLLDERHRFDAIVAGVSRHASLLDVRFEIEGNHVTLVCEYSTGEAAGQNMVTVCTQALCAHLLAGTPVTPTHFFVEGNSSGDKKSRPGSYSRPRGKKVTAECHLPQDVLRDVLQVEPERLLQYWRTAVMGAIQSGTSGMTGHAANALAAIFLACGQDVACVAEGYVGATRVEPSADGAGVYAAVTLPNLVVGTVGGGTRLPTQAACLELLGCTGPGSARRLAEVCAATVLCGELSIASALAAGHFTRAHASLGRRPAVGGGAAR